MQRKNLTIGVFGFGCVGQGLYDVLSRTQGLKVHIKKIGIKDATKTRNLPAHYFTTNRDEILFDPEIDVVVEPCHVAGNDLLVHAELCFHVHGDHFISSGHVFVFTAE